MSGLRDTLDEIDALKLEGEFDETQDDPEGPEEAGNESPPAEDEPDVDPDDADEPEEAEAEPPEEAESEPSDDEVEEVEADDEEDEVEPTVEVDGEEYPLSVVREWKEGRDELKATLTRKSQEWSQQRQQYEQVVEQARQGNAQQKKLVRDLTRDATVKKFLQKHPDALELLMEAPEDARQLIGNPEATEAFWQDYETLQNNPRLAERLVKTETGEADEEEVSAEVVRERNIQIAGQVWQGVEQAVEAIAEERGADDETKTEVLKSLLEVFGVPTDGSVTESDLFAGTTRAMQLMFRRDPQHGIILQRRMLDERFDLLEKQEQTKQDREAKKAEEHNAEVDAALKKENKPPKTPSGEGPTAPPEGLPEPGGKGIRGVMDAIDDLEIPV